MADENQGRDESETFWGGSALVAGAALVLFGAVFVVPVVLQNDKVPPLAPTTFLPVTAHGQIILSTAEKRRRRFFWVAAIVIVYAATLAIGTYLMKFGPNRLRRSISAEGYSTVSGHLAEATNEETVNESRVRCNLLCIFIPYYTSVIGITYWSARTGRLSTTYGLDWELYVAIFTCGCIWLVIQAILAVCRRGGREYSTAAFALSTVSAVVPLISDAVDTLKDTIFGGLCMISGMPGLQAMGYISWAYLLCIHVWLLSKPETMHELVKVYWGVYYCPTARKSRAGAGHWFMKLAAKLYEQTTPEKVQMIVLEDGPQGIMAVLYWFFIPRSALFVVALNILAPTARVVLALVFRKRLRAFVEPWLIDQLHQTMVDKNYVQMGLVTGALVQGKNNVCRGPFAHAILDRDHESAECIAKVDTDITRWLEHYANDQQVGQQGVCAAACGVQPESGRLPMWSLGLAVVEVVTHNDKPGLLKVASLLDSDPELVSPLVEHLLQERTSRSIAGHNVTAQFVDATTRGRWVLVSVLACFMVRGSEGDRHLTLDFTSNIVGDFGCVTIGHGLGVLTQLSSLELNFDGNDIVDGASTLGNGIGKLVNLTSLTLSLNKNKVRSAGCQGIGAALACLTNLSKLRLILGNNDIDSDGATYIAEGLGHLKLLTCLELKLWGNTKIGKRGRTAMANAIEGLPQLVSKDIIGCL